MLKINALIESADNNILTITDINTSNIYIVEVSDNTSVFDERGADKKSPNVLTSGQRVEVYYSGISTKSIPPKINAAKIIILDKDSDIINNPNENGMFVMRAKIESIDEKIGVVVTESQYADGPYFVITSQDTLYIGKFKEAISRDDLSENMIVEIEYSGQVMMSYPPQIVALKITVIE